MFELWRCGTSAGMPVGLTSDGQLGNLRGIAVDLSSCQACADCQMLRTPMQAAHLPVAIRLVIILRAAWHIVRCQSTPQKPV